MATGIPTATPMGAVERKASLLQSATGIIGRMQRLRDADVLLDCAFIGSVVSITILGRNANILLVIFGLLPILLNRSFYARLDLWSSFKMPLLVVACYLTYPMMTYALHGEFASVNEPFIDEVKRGALAALFFFVGLLRAMQIEDFNAKFLRLTPWFLLACFAYLTFEMLTTFQEQGCRIIAMTPFPFVPALFFTVFSFMCLLGWERKTVNERRICMGLLAMSVVVVNGYTGSRGIGVAQVVSFAALLIFVWRTGAKQLPGAREITVAGVCGVLGCIAVSMITGCGVFDRFATIFWTADELSNGYVGDVEDLSIRWRLEMWATSWDKIPEALIFGHGSGYDHWLIHSRHGFAHSHNQFLSWAIDGGVLRVLIGIILLMLPFLAFLRLGRSAVVVMIGMTLMWGVSMMFDSFLQQNVFQGPWFLMMGIALAIAHRWGGLSYRGFGSGTECFRTEKKAHVAFLLWLMQSNFA